MRLRTVILWVPCPVAPSLCDALCYAPGHRTRSEGHGYRMVPQSTEASHYPQRPLYM